MQELNELVQQASDPSQRELMVAHFSEKLGVSPARFLSGTLRREQPRHQQPAAATGGSLADLDRKQRQLVDFLVLYPEFLPELLQGGLDDFQCPPQVRTIITSLQDLAQSGTFMPEQLLGVLPEGGDRQYIADLLMRGPGDALDPDEQGRQLCDELLRWLQLGRRQMEGADLQQQINEAQQAGDVVRVMELLRKMQELVKKKSTFEDNLLKEV